MTSSPASFAAASGSCAVVPQSTVTTTARALFLQAQQRRRVRAIAFAHAVGHIDRGAGARSPRRTAAAAPPRSRRRHRNRRRRRSSRRRGSRGRAARRPASMSRRCAGSGSCVAQPRREKARRLGEADAALRQQPPDDLRQPEPLRDQQRPCRHRTSRTRQRRPQTERSTPRKAGVPRAATAVPSIASAALASSVAPNRAERREGLLAREIVLGLDIAHRAGLRAHHDRMRERAAGEAPHALQHRCRW